MTRQQGGRQAYTFLPPPRPARLPGQVEQKPEQGASAGAAVEHASQRLGGSGSSSCPALDTASLDKEGHGLGSPPAPSAFPFVAPVTTLPLGVVGPP